VDTAELDRLLLSYSVFQLTYRADPAAFVVDCIDFADGDGPSLYQLEILGEFVGRKRACVRGPHGLGKSAICAWIVLWFVLTRQGSDFKVVTTAGAWHQLTHFLWPEIHKWLGRLNWKKIGRPPLKEGLEVLRRGIRVPGGEAFAIASNNVDFAEGAHADSLLYVFDEAKSIPDELFDAAEGAFASPQTAEIYALALSTPGDSSGRFYAIQSRRPGFEDWWAKHVTLDEAIAANRIAPAWVEQRKLQWGEGSPIFRRRVLGEFAEEEEGVLIPLAWVEAAQERWLEWTEGGRLREDGSPSQVTAIGFDVGGGTAEGDASTIAIIYDHFKVSEVIKIGQARDPDRSLMELVGRINGLWTELHPQWLIGDIIGIGAAVVHRLRELGVPSMGYHAGAKTTLRDNTGAFGYRNWRAAGWFTLAEILSPVEGRGVCLPPDEELIGDLTTTQDKGITSMAERQVESKKEIRKRLKRSPDMADAVIHGMIGPVLFLKAQEGERVVFDPIRQGEW